ncbi:NB-ARC domain-containing protein [Streptomyces sp. NPDC001502]|uniref:NB-ARC domain-containing protein n=1 Tax=Streptomyces sp. NPDC001502 TaxID=3364578 RepID=UPI003678D17A
MRDDLAVSSVSDSGDAIASAVGAVAVSGHVDHLTITQAVSQGPVQWPLRLGSVPALASAFQQRPEVRDVIDQAVAGHTAVVLTQVLSGGGGVGKTQLASAYAHQALAEGVDLVVWVDASETDQVIARYAVAAHIVDAPNALAGQTGEEDARAFLQWLATTKHSWLVVLDDITDPDAMQPWWPPSSAWGRGRVVATTRRQDAVLSGGGRAVVDIATYSSQEADTYLRERLRSARAAHLLDAQTEVLAEALGYLPLALSHAAAYMINEDVPCTEYLLRFNSSAAKLDDLMPRHADTEGYGRHVATALLLSLDVAQACEPVGLAIPALRLAAVLDPAGHPRDLWGGNAVISYLTAHRAAMPPLDGSTDVSTTEAKAALRLLHRYGLITDDAQAGFRAVKLHALTARAVREHTPTGEQREIVRTAADALTELWHKGVERAVLRTNVESLDGCAGDLLWEVEGHHLLRWVGKSLSGGGLATSSVSYWQRVTATSERLLGRTHSKTLIARRELAVAYLYARRSKDAMAVFQEDYAYDAQMTAAADPAARVADVEKRDLYRRQDSAGFIALLEDTLVVRERLLGPTDPSALSCRVKLATAYWNTGKQPQAISLLKLVLKYQNEDLGVHHPSSMATAARLQEWQGESKRRWWKAPAGS